jgi:phage tail-like protein
MSTPPEDLPEILTSCRFYLELSLNPSDGTPAVADAYFMDCKGFKSTQEVVEICETTAQVWGNDQSRHLSGRIVRTKIPGNTKINNITLRRGMTRSQTLWQWFNAVQSGGWAKQRRDGSLSIYDQAGTVQARFNFSQAWPVSYVVSDLSAGSNDIEIEEMELAVEVFVRVNGG